MSDREYDGIQVFDLVHLNVFLGKISGLSIY